MRRFRLVVGGGINSIGKQSTSTAAMITGICDGTMQTNLKLKTWASTITNGPMKKSLPPTPHATSIVINGKTCIGANTNKPKMITVTTATGSKTFPIGNDSAVFRAKTLLGELVREGKA